MSKIKVVLVAGSFTSANVNVMLSVIRSIYTEVDIHIVAVQNYKDEIIESGKGLFCHPVTSIRWRFLQKMKYSTNFTLLCRAINVLCNYTFRIIDNFFPSSMENAIYRECETLIKQEGISHIFSVSDPFYSHRVSGKLAEYYNIKWSPVWLDSYSNGFCKQSRIWEWSSLIYEDRIFKKAPNIYAIDSSFVGNKLIHKYVYKVKNFRIPYLEEFPVGYNNKNIIYAGLLNNTNRNPYPTLYFFLRAIPKLSEDVLFHFYVRTPDEYIQFVNKSNGRIQFHPFVSRSELKQLMSDCYMCLIIGNAISFQLPSKVIESISYRKPILFFYTQENDPSFEFLNNYPDIFIQDITSVSEEDIDKFVAYLNKEHPIIPYSQLIANSKYKECTPASVKNIFLS